jgi:SPP1 gp7 family putative phage head morphogenesis protein
MNPYTTSRPEKLKSLIWKVTENNRQAFRAYGERIFQQALNAQFAPFIRELLRSGIMQEDLVGTRPMEDAFIQVYARVGTFFASESYGGITKSYHPKYEIKRRRRRRFVSSEQAQTLETTWLDYMKRFALTEAGDRIKKITDTTREVIRKSLDKSITQGLGIDEAAKELMKEWKGISKTRAKVIARTEIVSASNAGSFIGAQSTGLDLQKVWLSTRDSRTRDSHQHLDGEKVEMEEIFSNGLRYPGDPRGVAREVIQCRCTQTYEVRE